MQIGQEVNSIEELLSTKRVGKKKKHLPIPLVDSYVVPFKCFEIGLKLVCATNSRENWRSIGERKQNQREMAWLFTIQTFGNYLPIHNISVTITRIGKRIMDNDNLSTSAKYVRDGIADALGRNDNDPSIKWVYKQEIGKAYGCRVEIKSE